MLKIHNSPSSTINASKNSAKNPNFDSMELACSIDISKIGSPNDIHEFDKYGLEAPFSMQDMQTEESHQLNTPTNKAFNRIVAHSKVVEAHKGLRQEVLASTAPSDNIPQNARLSSLLLSKQTPNPHNATDKVFLSPGGAVRKSAQLTKSVETLIEKPKLRGANKRHTEPIKINTLKLCRDIEKKQRIRDNKPYVDLGSSEDDSDEIMEKIYEVPYSPALEGAVILEKLPEEGEMDEIDLDSGDFDTNKRESAARRWNKFIIKSSGSPIKEKYQPSFVLNPEEEKPKMRTSQSQTKGKPISRDMITVKKLIEKDFTTERSSTATTQSYKMKLNTTPRQSPCKDAKIDLLMMLDSAWNGLDTRENETNSSDEKLAAFIQERETPKVVQRSQSLENLQGGRKIRQSIQTMRPIIVASTQSEDNSPVMNHHPRHGSVSNRQKDIEQALKILDVNFPYDAPNNGRMINIKELIEKNRPATRIASAEKRRLNFDNIFQISPSVQSRKNVIPASASFNKVTMTPRKERPAFRVVEGDGTPRVQRSQSQKYVDGYFTKIKTTVVQRKELSIVRKDNGLARK